MFYLSVNYFLKYAAFNGKTESYQAAFPNFSSNFFFLKEKVGRKVPS